MNTGDTQQIINKYMKKWRVSSIKNIHLDSNIKKNVKREVGDIWQEDDKWCIQHEHFIEKRSTHPTFDVKDNKLFKRCLSCNKKVLINKKRSTEIDVMKTSGKCLKCHADEELNEIIEHGKPLRKKWMEKAVYRDSYGNTLISEDEILQEYGEDEYKKVKEKHQQFLNNTINEKSS